MVTIVYLLYFLNILYQLIPATCICSLSVISTEWKNNGRLHAFQQFYQPNIFVFVLIGTIYTYNNIICFNFLLRANLNTNLMGGFHQKCQYSVIMACSICHCGGPQSRRTEISGRICSKI